MNDIALSGVAPKHSPFPFPWKLHEMLENAASCHFEFIVSWLPQEIGFRVHDVKRFVNIIMPRYFNQTKYKSFQRQLNMWGFLRVSKGSNKGGYLHEHFIRWKPELCRYMKRQKIKGISPTTFGAESRISSPFLHYPPNIHMSGIMEQSTSLFQKQLKSPQEQQPREENPDGYSISRTSPPFIFSSQQQQMVTAEDCLLNRRGESSQELSTRFTQSYMNTAKEDSCSIAIDGEGENLFSFTNHSCLQNANNQKISKWLQPVPKLSNKSSSFLFLLFEGKHPREDSQNDVLEPNDWCAIMEKDSVPAAAAHTTSDCLEFEGRKFFSI